MLPRALPTGLVACAMLLAAQHPQAQQDALRTRAETSGYQETSSYDDVRRIVGQLAGLPVVHATTFGPTEEGRDLPLLVVSDPKVTTPEAARRLGRPIVL